MAQKLLKDVINERREMTTGLLTRRSRKKLRKRLARAKLGRWTGEGVQRKFVPLTRREQDELLLMIRHGQDSIGEDESIMVDEQQFIQRHGEFGFGQNWHMPYMKRPGMLNNWWGKGVAIKFRAKAYAKMVAWCQAVDTECSGLGKVLEHRDDTGKITLIEILDVMLFEQECTSGYTELDQEALQKFLFRLAQANEDPSRWKHWWHTHNDFGVFWSGIDDATVTRLIETFGSYLVSTCVNKKCDIIGRIDEMNKKNSQDSADCDVTIMATRTYKERSKWQAQAKRLVKKKVYTYPVLDNDFYTKGGKFTGFSQREAGRVATEHDYSEQDFLGHATRIPALSAALGNVMSNADRRRQGIPQDPELPDYLIGYGVLGKRGRTEHAATQPFFLNE